MKFDIEKLKSGLVNLEPDASRNTTYDALVELYDIIMQKRADKVSWIKIAEYLNSNGFKIKEVTLRQYIAKIKKSKKEISTDKE